MTKAPSGTVTFLFTDIEGSTKIAQQYPEEMQAVLAENDRIINSAVDINRGFMFQFVGDGHCCAFADAADAIDAAGEIQRALQGFESNGVVLKIRIGIHTGEAEWSGERYMGYMTLARTARIMSAAHGDQTLVSDATARHAFDRLTGGAVLRDLGERRLKDLIQPLKLYELILPGLRSEFPPIRALDFRPNNLPVQITGFIGREDEIESLVLMMADTRLLTITGPGGAGKTRLSLQLAADVMDEFPDGAWLVELAQIADKGLLAQAVMQALDIEENPEADPEDDLVRYLRDKRLLLIFDNCEHIVDEVAELVEYLLVRSSQTKILATSREALRCEGEQTFQLHPLKFPDPSVNESPEILTRYESVRLFIERALAVNRNFRVNEKNASALAQICFQLEGIPLALELAAARTGVLSLEQINQRLDNRFQLLKGGRRTALPRQQTLKAMIEWSYELLGHEEKQFWNQLSIFSNSFTIESTEAVCLIEGRENADAINLLGQLADKSVIYCDEFHRYRMLETIRQYGEEKLKESGNYEQTIKRHAEYFCGFAYSAEKQLRGVSGKEWSSALESESANIEKALKWSIESGNSDIACRLAGAMGSYWQLKGLVSEAVFWLSQTMKMHVKNTTPDLCRVFSHAGNFARIRGEFRQAEELLKDSLRMSKQIGDIEGECDTLNRLGILEYDVGNFRNSISYYEQNLEKCKERCDNLGIARTLNNLGNAYSNLGESAKGQELYEQSLLIRRQIGDKLGVAIALNNIGINHFESGDYERAVIVLEESLQIRREGGDKAGTAISLSNLGNTFYNQGYYDKAIRNYEQCRQINFETGDKYGFAETLYNLAKVFIAQNEIERAGEMIGELQVKTEELNADSLTVLTHYAAGRLAFMKGETEEADRFYRSSIRLYLKMGNYKDVDINLIRLAELLCERSCRKEAATIIGFVRKEYIESKGVKLPLAEQLAYDSVISDLKKVPEKNEVETGLNRGSEMTVEEAIEYSLSAGLQ